MGFRPQTDYSKILLAQKKLKETGRETMGGYCGFAAKYMQKLLGKRAKTIWVTNKNNNYLGHMIVRLGQYYFDGQTITKEMDFFSGWGIDDEAEDYDFVFIEDDKDIFFNMLKIGREWE